jgi:hypothetical protein
MKDLARRAVRHSDRRNHHQRAVRQFRADGRPRRLFFGKELAVDRVHHVEVLRTPKVDRDAHHLRERRPGGFDHGLEPLERAPHLGGDVWLVGPPRRLETHESGRVDEAAGDDGRRVNTWPGRPVFTSAVVSRIRRSCCDHTSTEIARQATSATSGRGTLSLKRH